MSWTMPNTPTAGTPITAAAIDANNTSLAAYIQKMPAAALQTTPWVRPPLIVRGRYDGVQTRAHFVSGQFGCAKGTNTYATAYQSHRLSVGEEFPVPGLTATFEVRTPATLFLQWSASGWAPDNQDADHDNTMSFFVWLGNSSLVQLSTETRLREEDHTTADIPRRQWRFFPTGFAQVDLSIGTYAIGVASKSQADLAKAHLMRFNLSYELFHL